MGMTLAQKVLARTSGRSQVDVGEVVFAEPDVFELIDLVMPSFIATLQANGINRFRYPERCVVYFDHEAPAHTVRVAALKRKLRSQLEELGIRDIYTEGRHGISHQAIIEHGHVLPGMLVVGPDTHLTTLGCVGALAPPLNYEAVQALATGNIWLKVPETIRVVLHGRPRPGVMSRDIAQRVISIIGRDRADYRVLEFGGPAIADLDMDARMTLCNVTVDIGAKSGIVPPDDLTLAYLAGRAKGPVQPISSDPDAAFEQVFEIALDELAPMVAVPPSPENVVDLAVVAGRKVDQVYIGSCAGGRLEDLRAAASVVKGRTIHPNVRMIVVPTTQQVYSQASREGLLAVFADAGAVVMPPSCGPCYGNLSPLADGEVCIGTGTTNMAGRMGSVLAEIYLANAAVAAASAIAGEITQPD
jgi:3-isopropylmalate/(R)-2-methylmalate dehydratase large subunit